MCHICYRTEHPPDFGYRMVGISLLLSFIEVAKGITQSQLICTEHECVFTDNCSSGGRVRGLYTGMLLRTDSRYQLRHRLASRIAFAHSSTAVGSTRTTSMTCCLEDSFNSSRKSFSRSFRRVCMMITLVRASLRSRR